MHQLSNRNLSSWRHLRSFQALSLTLVASMVWAPSANAQLPAPSSDQIELRIVSGAGAEFQPGSQQKQRLAVQVVNQDERPLAGVAVTFQLPDEGPGGLFGNGQRSMVAFTNEEGEASIGGIKWSNTPGSVSIRVMAVKGMAHAGTLLTVRLAAGSGTSIPQSSPQPGQTPGPAAPPTAGETQTKPAASIDIQPGTLRAPRADSASSAPQAGDQRPAVTISGAPQGHSGSSNKKWLVIALVAAGAAAGVTLALLKKSGSSASSASTNNPLSIGSPTVSVGP